MTCVKFNDDGTYTSEYWESRAIEADAIGDCMVNKVNKATMRAVAESYRLLARQAVADQTRQRPSQPKELLDMPPKGEMS